MAPLASPSTGFPPGWLVLIGASGGEGLRQMQELVGALPPKLDAAVLLVLHRPPDRPSFLEEIIARASRLPVSIPETGEPLRPGVCYLGAPDRHLCVNSGPLADFAPDHVYRGTNIDLLFESASRLKRPKVLGVILAGALRDGSAGLAAIKQAGGVAMIVDGEWRYREGMPRAALLGVPEADFVGSTEDIADAIHRLVGAVDPLPRASTSKQS